MAVARTQAHLINVAQDCLLHTFMLNDLTKNAAISAPDDQDLLWVGVRVHGQMGDHLLVCELVSLGALNDIVQNQNGAIVGGLEDEDILIFALLVVEDLLDFQGHSLARPHIGDLAEPSIYEAGTFVSESAGLRFGRFQINLARIK